MYLINQQRILINYFLCRKNQKLRKIHLNKSSILKTIKIIKLNKIIKMDLQRKKIKIKPKV
jgi:hypothetical protein